MTKRQTHHWLGWLQRWGMLPRRLVRHTEAEDLLKSLYEQQRQPAGTQASSSPILRHGPELSELLQQLRQEGYLAADSFALTERGEQRALELIRAHRLYELYLAEHSGYTPSEWHRLAHTKEHQLSSSEHQRIASLLGNPLYDPHGDPIPTVEGVQAELPETLPLEALQPGAWYYVLHIEDDLVEAYHYLTDLGLTRDSIFQLQTLESGICRLYYEGEAYDLPAQFLSSLHLRLATVQELKESHAAEVRRLSTLAPDESSTVLGLSPSCRGPMRRRLMDLGFVRGSHISIEMRSPLGNPTAYIVRGAAIALRRDQARYILIQDPKLCPQE